MPLLGVYMKKKSSTKPATKKLHFTVHPEQGMAKIACMLDPPEGYQFVSMERKGTKATITYRRVA